MDYRRLGRTGLKVSELCLGTMTFGWTSGEPEAHRVFDAAFDAGINFIDTADVYSRWAPGNPGGVAERFIGDWLRTKPRHRVIIATKVRARMGDGPNDEGLSRAHIMVAVEDSLRRLQTDHIDLYQTHSVDETTPLDETLRALDDLVRQGKVRYLGCSNYPAWQATKSLWISDRLGLARFDSVQPRYNLVWRQPFEQELMPLCLDQGLGVIPYAPLQGGFLTGKYRRGEEVPKGSRGEKSEMIRRHLTERNFAILDRVEEIARARERTAAQVAIAWLLATPAVTSPIFGVNTTEQLSEILGAVEFKLSAKEKRTLDEASAWQA